MFAQSASHGIGGDPLKWGYACTLTAGSVLPVSRKGSIYMVDGSGTINRLTPLPKGAVVDLHFNAAPTLVHSTLLLLPGSANVTVDAGSVARFISLGNGVWRCAALDTTYGRQLAAAVSASAARTTLGLASVPREVLTAARTYYVRTDGSDSNNGLANTSGGAFLTIQKAINIVSALDIGTYTVTIQVGAGTYTAGVSVTAPWVGSGTVEIVGDTTTPTNCVISTTSAHCVTVSNAARISIKGFRLQTTTAGSCINASSYGSVTLTGNMNFHTCANFHLLAYGGTITSVGGNSYTITGNAAAHLYSAGTGSKLEVISNTVTLTGTLTFSVAFAQAEALSTILSYYSTFSGGTVTGTRYAAITNSIINTGGGGASHYPGSVGGTTGSGGIYI